MKLIKKILIFFVILVFLAGAGHFIMQYDIKNITKKIQLTHSVYHDDEYMNTLIESYEETGSYDFENNKIVLVCFTLDNSSSYTLRDVKMHFSSEYEYEEIGHVWDGCEIIATSKFETRYILEFYVNKNIDEKDFVDSLKYSFDFSVFNCSLSISGH